MVLGGHCAPGSRHCIPLTLCLLHQGSSHSVPMTQASSVAKPAGTVCPDGTRCPVEHSCLRTLAGSFSCCPLSEVSALPRGWGPPWVCCPACSWDMSGRTHSPRVSCRAGPYSPESFLASCQAGSDPACRQGVGRGVSPGGQWKYLPRRA